MTRKITLLALLIVTTLTFGCKKDQVEKDKDRLLGSWTVERSVRIYYLNDRETDRAEYTDDDYTFEFASNGGGRVIVGDEQAPLTWVLAENFLTLKFEGETYLFSLRNLNDSEMQLVSEEVRTSSQGTRKDVVELYLRKL